MPNEKKKPERQYVDLPPEIKKNMCYKPSLPPEFAANYALSPEDKRVMELYEKRPIEEIAKEQIEELERENPKLVQELKKVPPVEEIIADLES